MEKNMKIARNVVLAVMAIALALILLIAGSYALFTDTVRVENHLSAGTLEATLTRKTLVGNTTGDDGYLTDYTGKKDVDFSGKTEENMFDLDQSSNIVPGMYRTANMELRNDSSVAFAYWIEIVLTDPTEAKDVALSEQLLVTVTTQNSGVSANGVPVFNDGTNKIVLGSVEAPVGVVTVGTAQEFSVTVTFKDYGAAFDDNENNKAQDGTVYFDMIVYAVQVTRAN